MHELTGIAFDGAPYEHVFFVADTHMTGPMVPDELNSYLWRDGFHLFFPMRGSDHWRIVGIVPAATRGRDDLTLDDVMPSIRDEAGAGVTVRRCTWFSPTAFTIAGPSASGSGAASCLGMRRTFTARSALRA